MFLVITSDLLAYCAQWGFKWVPGSTILPTHGVMNHYIQQAISLPDFPPFHFIYEESFGRADIVFRFWKRECTLVAVLAGKDQYTSREILLELNIVTVTLFHQRCCSLLTGCAVSYGYSHSVCKCCVVLGSPVEMSGFHAILVSYILECFSSFGR